MKIGIVTFHASLNCGSMLQAYALQETLREKFHQNVEIIDFSSKGQRKMYSLIDTRLRPRVIKRNFRVLPYLKEFKDLKADYKRFSDTYFVLTSKQYRRNQELFGLQDTYDILIAGGDQVWNVLCRDTDLAYFLNFSNSAKKVSYSPSLGAVNINYAAKNLSLYKNLLEQFDYISVREPNGKDWLEKLLGRNVEMIVDPTMLFTPNEWTHKIKIEKIDEPFIFYYAFDYSNHKLNLALQRISKDLGVKIFMIDRKEWNICHLNNYGIELYPHGGPMAFISMINSAKYVVTDSFHGTVFSALFNKKFCNCRHNPNQDVNDDRSSSLLAELGLERQYVVSDQLKKDDLTREIDYSSVNDCIEKLREKGFLYIKSFLGEDS